MELQKDELKKIIKAYRLEKELFFDGFEWVEPDEVLYYFHDTDDILYVLVASDFILWGCGNGEPPKNIHYEANRKTEKDFPVKRWLTKHDGLDESDPSGDYEGYIYWASNSDLCAFAEIEGKYFEFDLKNVEKVIPYHSDSEVAFFAKRRIAAEIVTPYPRPPYQTVRNLEKNIREIILRDIGMIIGYFLRKDANKVTEEDLEHLGHDSFLYIGEWNEAGGREDIEKMLVRINNQCWLALCEIRERPKEKNELMELLGLLKELRKNLMLVRVLS